MSPISRALDALYGVLGSIEGVRLQRVVGARLDPPAATVKPPALTWVRGGRDPDEATFTVAVVVADDGRSLEQLIELAPLVAAALDALPSAVVRTATPGVWAAGGGDLPAYLIDVEMAL